MSLDPAAAAAAAEEEEESMDHTLLVVREVSVYKIPPRPTSGGYNCGDWLQSDRIWSGRLRVVSCQDRCEIRLEDPVTGELFAACFVYNGRRGASVESVLDSSRYFVLRIEDGRGKHAFIGLGFNERNEAFDFNVALSDHDKYVKRTGTEGERVGEGVGGDDADNHTGIHPAVNHRLKEGETIHINVKNKSSGGTGMLSAAHSVSGQPKAIGLAPPPGGSIKIRSPLPPPPNDPATARRNSGSPDAGKDMRKETTGRLADPLYNLSELERNLPLKNPGSSKSTSASGWAAF